MMATSQTAEFSHRPVSDGRWASFNAWLEQLNAHVENGNPIGELAARDLLATVNALYAAKATA